MQITFRTRSLQKRCSERKEAVKAYGDQQARKLMQRLMELNAFRNLSEVPHRPPLRRHELSGDRKGTFAVDLVHPFRLIFIPDHDPVPRTEDGGINLAAVTSIQIIEIGDYH